MSKEELEKLLLEIIERYHNSISQKAHADENDDTDPLMDAFGITPDLKRENRQYWGRELGMCWQRLVDALCSHTCQDYRPALVTGSDELCDFRVGRDAIDTKYRIGSGDSGTLKKFRSYGKELRRRKYRPLLLIVREDNLPAAITACKTGQWDILTGDDTFDYIKQITRFDLKSWLMNLSKTKRYRLRRK